MQHRSQVSADTTMYCPFCHRLDISMYILKETSNFYLVVDHAPLLEGHLLIIPKRHYTCYGAVSASLDTEYFELKAEVQQFFLQYYAAPVYFEHGIFRQTVFHAHLHCFPFGEIHYNPASNLHATIIHTQDDLRCWHREHGHYLYIENREQSIIFPPDPICYRRVIQEVLWPGAASRLGSLGWRSPQQRSEEGEPLIKATITKWHTFEYEGVSHVN
jgi:diadenosine tetraphosphate (Ap4A) HIT family hydrolase